MLHLFVQAVPASGDWVATLLTATGPAGVVSLLLWKVRQDAEREKTELRAEVRDLTNRLFVLADRGMAVGQTASEVVKADNPGLNEVMQRIEALLDERGKR